MQTNSKKEIKVVGLLTAAFFLGGIIHVVMGPWDFTSCVAQIYYSALVLVWAITINYRVVDKKVRKMMIMTAGLFMLAFFLQMCRYRIFEDFDVACRYFWYGYYIPIVMVPVLFLFVVLHLHLQENEKIDRRWFIMIIPAFILVLLVMTNDIHQMIFIFTDGTEGKSGTYRHGILFYGIYVWVIAILIMSLYIAIKKCRIPSIGKKLWIPLYFAAYGILIVLSIFDIPKIAGTSVWIFIECLTMIIIGMEESCIQLGLIPANSSYRLVAKHANKQFVISDEKGLPVYASDTAKEMFQKKETVQIHTKPIKGGSVSWAVDLSEIMMLSQEIEKTTEKIESRNEYLKSENALKEERSRLAARNNLYNQIAEIVSPQLNTIGQLLENADDKNNLARIAFLNAYIKRRSNMELLKSDKKLFPTEELASAIRESSEYLKLCGVDAMLHITPESELSADTQIFLYESFETVVENCLDTLKFLLINVLMHENQPVLRMTVNAPNIDKESINKAILLNNNICLFSEADDDEVTITIRSKEGGMKK